MGGNKGDGGEACGWVLCDFKMKQGMSIMEQSSGRRLATPYKLLRLRG